MCVKGCSWGGLISAMCPGVGCRNGLDSEDDRLLRPGMLSMLSMISIRTLRHYRECGVLTLAMGDPVTGIATISQRSWLMHTSLPGVIPDSVSRWCRPIGCHR